MIIKPLPEFGKELPTVYDNGMTYWTSLNCVIRTLNEIIAEWDANQGQIEDLQNQIDDLKAFLAGDAFAQYICEWCNVNLPCLITSVCKFFAFSLDDDGHVMCSIPLTWEWMNIHWNMEYGTEDFGKILIGW